MVLQIGNQHPGRGYHGVVQGMGQVHLAILSLDPHPQATGLGVAQIGAGADLKVFLLPGAPGLNVAGLDLQVGQVAGAALQLTHGNVHAAEQLHGVAPHFFVPGHGILRLADYDHLLLLKLVDAVDAPLLNAVGTLLLAEAGGIAGEGLGQALLGNDLVDELADHGVLGGADQVQVLPFDFVHHGVHIRLAHNAFHHVAMDHEGGDAVGEALIDHEVTGVGQHGGVEPGNIAHQVIEAVAGDPTGGIHIHAVEALHDLSVIGDLVIGHHRLAEALHLYVGAVIRANRDGGINDIGDGQHNVADLLGVLLLQLLQLCQPVSLGLDLGLDGLCFLQLGGVFLGLTHQHADLLGKGVALGPDVTGLGDGSTVLAVQLQHLIHQGELCVLELLPDVLLDNLRILSDKLDIEHGFLSPQSIL